MDIIEPINAEQQNLVIAETHRYIHLASNLYDCRFTLVPVLFDLPGQAAGMYKARGKERLIRYNPWLFAKYWHDNFSATVPHEVAHYVVDCLYRRVQPHGAEWRSVMADFGADDSRTVDFDMTGIPRRQSRTVDYVCACRTHKLSMQRHNRVLSRRARYLCRYCKGPLSSKEAFAQDGAIQGSLL